MAGIAMYHKDDLIVQRSELEAVAGVVGMIKAELRPYQREGISWLAFLQRCGLHGVLADDMGLGKTLQATAIIAGEHRHSAPYHTLPNFLAGIDLLPRSRSAGLSILDRRMNSWPPETCCCQAICI